MTIGLISAEPNELAALQAQMIVSTVHSIAGRQFITGQLYDQDIVLVLAHVGKVAAATTTTVLIQQFDVDFILFAGIAGAADPKVQVGDVLIADYLIHHDVDIQPFRPRFTIPLAHAEYNALDLFPADTQLSEQLLNAAQQFLNKQLAHTINSAQLATFAITQPKASLMTIASGDQFISNASELAQLANEIKSSTGQVLGAVEMEGAAVAQVCTEYAKPFAVLRVISDNANHTAAFDFEQFLQQIASQYIAGIIQCFFSSR